MFLKRLWGPLIIYVFATSIVLLFIVTFMFEKNIALSDINNWVGIMLGFSSWIVGLISLYLSFYNVDKMIDAQNDNLEKMRETKEQIQNEVNKLKRNGWQQEGKEWCYFKNGELIRNEFRKSGNNWYYIGCDGYMVKNYLLEEGDGRYYMDANGIMVTDAVVDVSVPKVGKKTMYFGKDGKAVKEGTVEKDGISYLIEGYYIVKSENKNEK